MMRSRYFLLLLCLCMLSCAEQSPSAASPSPSPSPEKKATDPLSKAIEEEWIIQDDEDPDNRMPARKAALDYLKAAQPSVKAEGVNLYAYAGNLYLATIDVSGQQSIKLIVRMYIKDDGQVYWKAEPLTDEAAQQFPGYLQHKYRTLKGKYDALQQ